MTRVVVCECGTKLAAREEHAGRRVRCSACRRVLTIPPAGGGDGAGGRPARRRVFGSAPPPHAVTPLAPTLATHSPDEPVLEPVEDTLVPETTGRVAAPPQAGSP